MLKSQHSKSGALRAVVTLAAVFFAIGVVPAKAGPFSWLKGPQPNQDSQDYDNNTGRGGLFGGIFGGGQRQAPQPGSRAFHGDELPPAEGNAAYREWIVNPALGSPTLSARNIEPTKDAIERYKGIVAQGGWPMVPAQVMKPGMRGQVIVTLHQRLEISGDLVGRSIPEEYDAAVVAAVKNFQARHNLPPTGIIDNRATIEALNVPAVARLAQLEASLKRLQSLTPAAGSGGRYVTVNIPSAQVEAVENGQVVSRHAAVVGKYERPTPEVSSKVQEINFNPYWYVPKTIIYKDLVPKAREFTRRGQDFLAAYHMQAFDAAGNPLDPRQIDWNGSEVYNYNFRQLPWQDNSLGFVKINFPNKDSVYMHDTPLKSLFERSVRFDSSGCVRVHNVETLVTWLLRDTPGWSYERVVSMKETGEQIDVKLTKPVPVYLAYISAWGTPDGEVNFRPDIYGLDGASATASAY